MKKERETTTTKKTQNSLSLTLSFSTPKNPNKSKSQWLNSEPCGMCLKFRGFSKGAGANPVTNETRYVMVTNLCPECYTGDLDQELPGDGRWIIEWEPVQCNVGYTPFIYSFQGSNGYFMKFQVSFFLFLFFASLRGEREKRR